VLGDGLALRARIGQWPCLHALRDLVDLGLAQLAVTRQRELLGDRDVPTGGAAVRAGLTRTLPHAVPRRPAAKQLSNVDHG
jgi:hypothetical protein